VKEERGPSDLEAPRVIDLAWENFKVLGIVISEARSILTSQDVKYRKYFEVWPQVIAGVIWMHKRRI
jgi:hypothetical protein